jgi:hypothetical protein
MLICLMIVAGLNTPKGRRAVTWIAGNSESKTVVLLDKHSNGARQSLSCCRAPLVAISSFRETLALTYDTTTTDRRGVMIQNAVITC